VHGEPLSVTVRSKAFAEPRGTALPLKVQPKLFPGHDARRVKIDVGHLPTGPTTAAERE